MGTSDLGFALGGHRVQWNRTDPNDHVKSFRGVNHCGPYPISEPNATFGPKRPPIRMRSMPDPRTLAETESAMNRHIEGLESGFVVMWVVWIWDGMETRHVAESAAISKATLTGVMKTLESRGWLIRESSVADRRLVQLRL